MKQLLLVIAALLWATTALPARTDMTANMVDFWDMDEASGNIVGEHASITLAETGGTIGTSTIGGRAARDLELGVPQYFWVADSSALSLSSDQAFTVAARVQWESATTSSAIVSKDDTSNREFLMYHQHGTGIRLIVWESGGTNAVVTCEFSPGAANPTNGVPYTIVAWHNPVADEVGIQVNAETPCTSAWTLGTRDQSARFQIGAGIGEGTFTVDGLIGSVGYWKRVLTSDERTEYYAAGAGVAYADIDAGGGGAVPCNRSLLGVGCEDSFQAFSRWIR